MCIRDSCRYLDGKLRWQDPSSVWTETVFRFFSEYNKKQHTPFKEEREYMKIDYIWRYDLERDKRTDIVLAVEHEANVSNIREILSKEMRHLIDIKAYNKVGIFYINLAEEDEFVNRVSELISRVLPYRYESYLIIIGYSAGEGKRMLFKGFFLNEEGKLIKQKKCVINQRY